MINKETYNRLKPYFIHLRRGYKGDYVYGLLQKDFDALFKIYVECGGNERLRYTCNNCCLRLTKFLGKLYYEYEDEMNKIKTPPLSDEVVEAITEEPLPKEVKEEKKKRTRKKKESQ